MDRSVPSDAEMPEGPGAKLKQPVRVLHRPSEQDERPFPSVLLSGEDIPPEMRVIQPPTKDPVSPGRPSLKECEESIADQLAGIVDRKRKDMLREIEKPSSDRLLDAIRVEREKMAGGSHDDVATEGSSRSEEEKGGDTGGVRVEAGQDGSQRARKNRKGPARRK